MMLPSIFLEKNLLDNCLMMVGIHGITAIQAS